MRSTLLAMLLLSMSSPLLSFGQAAGWALLRLQIRTAYPEIRQLSTDSLAAWLSAGNRPAPLLLDVRPEEEYAVSHLKDARRLDPDAGSLEALQDLPKDTPIVTYCSVGYRSSGMARRLQAAGFTNVMNLEGSIFAWANEGRPVYRDDQVVRQVHPYDKKWGVLLDKPLHAYAPSPQRK